MRKTREGVLSKRWEILPSPIWGADRVAKEWGDKILMYLNKKLRAEVIGRVVKMSGEVLGQVISTPTSPTHTTVDFEVKRWEDLRIGKITTISSEVGKEFVAVITSPHIHREEYSDPSLVRYYTDKGRDPSHVLPDIGSYAYMSARIIGIWDGSDSILTALYQNQVMR